jgi:hypothetical protein
MGRSGRLKSDLWAKWNARASGAETVSCFKLLYSTANGSTALKTPCESLHSKQVMR